MEVEAWSNAQLSMLYSSVPIGVDAYLSFDQYNLSLTTQGNGGGSYIYGTGISNGNSALYKGATGVYYTPKSGESLTVRMAMTAYSSASVTANDQYLYNTAFAIKDEYVDASNTGRFFVDELPSGVTVTSASGYNYLRGAGTAAAPEPQSVALIVSAMFLFLPLVRPAIRRP